MPDIFVALSQKRESAQKIETKKPEKNKHQDEGEKKNTLLPVLENRAHIFSAYCEKPTDIYFKNQEQGEKVLLFLRKHFVTNLKWIVLTIILALLPIFVIFLLTFLSIEAPKAPISYIVFYLLFYYLVVASYAFINFITWYFNLALITNIRVVDIDFSGLIYKNIAATKLNLIQDVSFDQIGVLPTFFNYGDVIVQTAGNLENFDFDQTPKPEDSVHIVHDLIGRGRHARP